jgi:hypothetical protein
MHTTGAAGPGAIHRRTVSYDPTTSTLVVGARSVTVGCEPGDNECLLRTYLDLVAEQRHVPLGTAVHLRRDDVVVLAQLLDLDDETLEARLQRLLQLSQRQAAALTRRLRRNRVAVAVGIGVLTAVPAVNALVGSGSASASPSTSTVADESPTTEAVVPTTEAAPETTVTVIVPTTEAVEPAPVVAADPAPVAPEPEPAPADVGYSVRYERDPDFVAPEGVDIGDAMVIERDAPPAP